MEYMQKYTVAANSTAVLPIPSSAIRGIYSPDTPVEISWIFNGEHATIVKAAALWEPSCGFNPAQHSQIEIKNATATATEILIRCDDGLGQQ